MQYCRSRRKLPAFMLVLPVVLFSVAAYGDESDAARIAFDRVARSDRHFRDGRPGIALEGYQSVVREFPTWWLPNLKAAVASRAVHQPDETIDTWLERASGMAPTGLYLDLVREIRNAEKGRMRDLDEALPALIQGESVSAPPAADALETRWRLVRASRFQDAGRVGATVTEYRAVLARDPGCQAARWRLAEVLASLDRPAQAAAILGEGVFRSLHPARWNAAIRGLSGLLKPE